MAGARPGWRWTMLTGSAITFSAIDRGCLPPFAFDPRFERALGNFELQEQAVLSRCFVYFVPW